MQVKPWQTREKVVPKLLGIIIAGLFLVVAGKDAYAIERIILDEAGQRQPIPIAITEFVGDRRGQDISQVIAADLERSGLFMPIKSGAFIQTAEALQTGVRFADWKAINAQLLVQGRATATSDGMLRVEFRLWSVLDERQLVGKAFSVTPKGWRRIAHKVADAIYSEMTGEGGYFDTQVVFVSESGIKTKRVKRLTIMDQDGENMHYLTNGADMVLTPRFSPNSREITYMSFYKGSPRVYLLQLDSGRRELLGDFPGMTFAPRFSPDGNAVVFSMAREGNTQIYRMDLRTRKSTRLTNHPSINTSPSYSPDGGQITFNSDRSGGQQIYVMSAGGGDGQRISFGDGRYATPVWSPRGDLIAFTKIKGGRFYVGVMRPDGSGERQLSEGYLVEGPTWAPNGRVLMFFRDEGGGPKLYSIDLTGFNERFVKTPQDASDPAWSPLIP